MTLDNSQAPVVSARGVVNLSSWIDLILAGRLLPGAVAVMGYRFRSVDKIADPDVPGVQGLVTN